MANLWNSVAAKVGRLARRELESAQGQAPSPSLVARRRQVVVLQHRRLVYAPDLDGRADPGEVVWTWVAFEDDPHLGKDRPVLVVGRDNGTTLFGLMLSSQRDREGQRHWLALGSGAWDTDEGQAGYGSIGYSRCGRPASGVRARCWTAPGLRVCRALRDDYG